MINSTQACKILSTICKTYRGQHSFDSCALTQTLKEYLSLTTNYNLDTFIVKSLRVKGRVNKCLFVISSSGKHIPITQSKIKVPTRRQEVLMEMREAIQYQIDEYRQQQSQLRAELVQLNYKELARELLICPLTGKFLSSGNIHVDHVQGLEFIRLADAWLLTKTKYRYFKDIKKLDVESWSKFHQENAVLQLASAKANIKKGSSNYKSFC